MSSRQLQWALNRPRVVSILIDQVTHGILYNAAGVETFATRTECDIRCYGPWPELWTRVSDAKNRQIDCMACLAKGDFYANC